MGQLLDLLSAYFLLLLALALLSLAFYRSNRVLVSAFRLAATGSLIFFILCTPVVSDSFVSLALRNLPNTNQSLTIHYNTVIVLGGGTYRSTLTGRTHLGTSGDRLLLAATLANSDRVDTLVFSGGGPGRADGQSEAETDSSIVSSWGVDRARMLVETESSNTIENAEFVLKLWPELHEQRVGVITSLLHMERALLALCYQGIKASPLVAEVHPNSTGRYNPLRLLPTVSGLRISSYYFKEYLAILIYRFKYGAPEC